MVTLRSAAIKTRNTNIHSKNKISTHSKKGELKNTYPEK